MRQWQLSKLPGAVIRLTGERYEQYLEVTCNIARLCLGALFELCTTAIIPFGELKQYKWNRIAIVAPKGQLLEFGPSPVFLLVSAVVSLTTLLELSAGTVSVVLMAFHEGRLGLVFLMRCSWTNRAHPRREASMGPASHHHPLVYAASTSQILISAMLSLPTFCTPL